MDGITVVVFFVGAAAGYLLGLWASRQTVASLLEEREDLQNALMAERKRRFAAGWEVRRLQPCQQERRQ